MRINQKVAAILGVTLVVAFIGLSALGSDRLEEKFISYVDEVWSGVLLSEFLCEARYSSGMDFERTQDEFYRNLYSEHCGIMHSVLYRNIEETYGAFAEYNKRIYEEIELAIMFTRTEINPHAIRSFVYEKANVYFGGTKWEGRFIKDVMDQLGLPLGICSDAGPNDVDAYFELLYGTAQTITRDILIMAIADVEGSITGYLEMTEQDPR